MLLVHGFGSNTLFNWVKTGWLDPLADLGRTVISLDLPGHGASKDVNPAGLGVGQVTQDIQDIAQRLGGPAELHGYSLGSRLAWAFAHEHPDLVSSLVLGGPPVSDDVYRVDPEQARAWARGGTEPEDATTRRFITTAAALPDQHLQHVVELRLSLAEDRYAPEESVPAVPTLVVAGEKDPISAGAQQLADLVTAAGAPGLFTALPGRNHVNALTSREYKSAVIDFLGR